MVSLGFVIIQRQAYILLDEENICLTILICILPWV